MNNQLDPRFIRAWTPVYGDGTSMERTGSLFRTASPEIPLEEKVAIFDAYDKGANALKRIALAMQAPLKNKLDYVGVGRKLLLVDSIPQGDVPLYDLDIPESIGVKVSGRGVAPVVETFVKRIEIPTFQIMERRDITYEEQALRRYSLFQRGKERVAIAMAAAEDTEIFSAIDVAARRPENLNQPIAITGAVTKAHLTELWGNIASRQLAPATYLLHPWRYGQILNFGSDDLDQVSLNVIVETGQYGVLFGSRLIASTKLPNKKAIYMLTSPDKLGRMPERQTVQVKIWDKVGDAVYQIVGIEYIGIGIFNINGVALAE